LITQPTLSDAGDSHGSATNDIEGADRNSERYCS